MKIISIIIAVAMSVQLAFGAPLSRRMDAYVDKVEEAGSFLKKLGERVQPFVEGFVESFKSEL